MIDQIKKKMPSRLWSVIKTSIPVFVTCCILILISLSVVLVGDYNQVKSGVHSTNSHIIYIERNDGYNEENSKLSTAYFNIIRIPKKNDKQIMQLIQDSPKVQKSYLGSNVYRMMTIVDQSGQKQRYKIYKNAGSQQYYMDQLANHTTIKVQMTEQELAKIMRFNAVNLPSIIVVICLLMSIAYQSIFYKKIKKERSDPRNRVYLIAIVILLLISVYSMTNVDSIPFIVVAISLYLLSFCLDKYGYYKIRQTLPIWKLIKISYFYITLVGLFLLVGQLLGEQSSQDYKMYWGYTLSVQGLALYIVTRKITAVHCPKCREEITYRHCFTLCYKIINYKKCPNCTQEIVGSTQITFVETSALMSVILLPGILTKFFEVPEYMHVLSIACYIVILIVILPLKVSYQSTSRLGA
ncbi:hypothetical protein [Kurthia sibirica]|uniref:Uncharacterized protein n=1 Tax=Kurthia sibirica TaxID=202750 RepID=A0A2U3ANA6_9BACL|nr:hypothetical protein [Kurthia sibirica]PWI26024.1 hypothetical protein DEX24_05710 [Kurthia sibirica]GEK34575.1 hypothetical protein KSI01_21080 [Kurthia sibirica]